MKINDRFPPELLQILTHFYRGEVQRATDWRKRLDTTTNWAIVAMTATFSWSFGSDVTGEGNHIVFVFTSLIIFLLMSIEARRYRYFDVWRTRVRMLEVHLLMPSLNPEIDIVQGDWREALSNDLLVPSFKISFSEALAKRLRANYLWIFLGLLMGWALRVFATQVETGESFYETCGYGQSLPPWAVLAVYAGFWLVLIWILASTWARRTETGEIRRRNRTAKQWPI